MLVHLHVKNLALIEESEVEFGPGLNILTGETGAGKSILLGSIQLILGGKTSRSMIRENASYALVELLFQVENTKARESLAALDIYPEDGQVLMSRKIMDGRSINKINGETSTVSQMKAAAACLLDIHGQHEHQSLLYGDRQLAILDVYGKEQILPAREKVRKAYQEYRDCVDQLKALDMDEEQRNREKAFLEFEINEIEEAALIPGEDETLEDRYRKLSNARRIMETAQMVRGMTGYEQGAADMTGNALKEFSRIADYDKDLAPLQEALVEIDSLLSDFCRDLSSYMDSLTFDEETFFETEKRLDLINSLKAKYGQTIHEILSYQKEQQEKLEKLQRFEENFRLLKEKLMQAEKILEEASHELSEIRKKYSKQLDEKIIEGLKDGTLDAIVTDHAPHHANDKDVEYNLAAFGISGIETSFAFAITYLYKAGALTLSEIADKMSRNPSDILNLGGGKIEAGGAADLTIADLNEEFVVDSAKFVSKGKNTPFNGRRLSGVVKYTLVDGDVKYKA